MLGHAEEEVVRQLAVVVEHGHAPPVSSEATRLPGTNVMSALRERATSASDVSGDGGTGVPNGITKVISQSSRSAARRQVVVQRAARTHSAPAGT